MKISEIQLRKLIKEEIKLALESPGEKYPWEKTAAWPGERSIDDEEELVKKEKGELIRRGASPDDARTFSDMSFDDQVDDLRLDPEFSDVESFVDFKMGNDENTYTTIELQALTRNVDFDERGIEGALPTRDVISRIKKDLSDYGLIFQPRQSQKHFRGAMSNAHGQHPFAGSGGGGSGFSSMGLGQGGGTGTIGGGGSWSSSQKGSLSMGSRRK